MEPLIIQASDFASRDELDVFVKNELGDNIDDNRKAGHIIQGTIDELQSLQLSPSTRVYGVKVVIKS